MGRTKQQQREETTQALLTAARRLFATEGFAETSLDAVTTAAGVTKGALYHHFASKTGLFRAVLTQVQAEVAERVVAAAEIKPDPWSQLRAGCFAFLSASSAPELQRIMLIDGPAVLGWHEWRAIDEESSAQHLTESLQTLIDGGIIATQPVQPLARLLSGAMNEAALWLAESPNRDKDLADTMSALDTLLNSLRQR